MSCGFAGNTDIYGIGIRIGYYTQALAVWFSNYFLYREVQGLRAVNNLFLLALCIAATIYFANASTTRAVEAFLMLQIGLVIGLVGITERSRFSSKYVKNSKERIILRMVIIMAGGLFNVCFWWRELDVMLPTPCASQDGGRDATYIFYFTKANIYGWAGILMKIKSLVAVVWTAPKIITFDAIVLLYDLRLNKTRTAFITAVEHSKSVRGNNHTADAVLPNSNGNQRLVSMPPPSADASQRNMMKPSAAEKINIKELQTADAIESVKLLREIDHAMEYIETVFSIYPPDKKPINKKRKVRLCGKLLNFHFSYRQNPCTDRSASFTQCFMVYLKSHLTNKPPFDLRWRIAVYMTASGQHPASRWPRILHRMYTLGEASPPPDWRHVAIASDIMLTQIPVVITRRTWMLMASYQFLFIVILVLQVELTIFWNNVSGLQSLSSLGQLIPFILGVGGLIKVLWGKWTLVSKGIGEERNLPSGEYEEAMAKFIESRKAGKERAVIRAATA